MQRAVALNCAVAALAYNVTETKKKPKKSLRLSKNENNEGENIFSNFEGASAEEDIGDALLNLAINNGHRQLNHHEFSEEEKDELMEKWMKEKEEKILKEKKMKLQSMTLNTAAAESSTKTKKTKKSATTQESKVEKKAAASPKKSSAASPKKTASPKRVQKKVESSVSESESGQEPQEKSILTRFLDYFTKKAPGSVPYQQDSSETETESDDEGVSHAAPSFTDSIKSRVARSFEQFASNKTDQNPANLPASCKQQPPPECVSDNNPQCCVWYTDALPLGLGVGLGVGIPAVTLGIAAPFIWGGKGGGGGGHGKKGHSSTTSRSRGGGGGHGHGGGGHGHGKR